VERKLIEFEVLSDQIEQMRAMVEDFHLKKPFSSS
jgi:hypothetical protein